MDCLPIVGGHHFDRIPGTTVEKGAVRTFADALLAADTQIRINFNSSERWVILVRHPEHAGFDRTILDASWRARAAGATVGGDRKNTRPLFACRFAVALRHGPMFFYDVEHVCLCRTGIPACLFFALLALRNYKGQTECVSTHWTLT